MARPSVHTELFYKLTCAYLIQKFKKMHLEAVRVMQSCNCNFVILFCSDRDSAQQNINFVCDKERRALPGFSRIAHLACSPCAGRWKQQINDRI